METSHCAYRHTYWYVLYAHSFAFPRPFFFAGAASGSVAAGAAAGGDGSLLGRRRFTFFLPPVAPVAGVVLLEAAPELEAAPPAPNHRHGRSLLLAGPLGRRPPSVLVLAAANIRGAKCKTPGGEIVFTVNLQ